VLPPGSVPLLTRAATLDLLRRYDHRPRTSLGQHFLVDPNTIRKIVRLADVGSGDGVVEVGAGLGALTVALAETGADVVAIEQDRSLEPALREVLAPYGNVRLAWGDALGMDLGRLTRGRPAVMVANLPYQIATPLLVGSLERARSIERYLVMVQREVGMRLVAPPGSSSYGAVSVKIAYLAEARMVSRISRRVFLPEPAVESVLVELVRRDAPPVRVARGRLFAFVEASFAQRRKTLRNALRGAGVAAADVDRALQASGVDVGARAEELSLAELAAVASRLPAVRGRR
jgi:16S rRNA (adenine1518-N6/adenine1519-N6)-dimethyltransferase